MNSIFKILAITLISILIAGCADNVKRYKADPSLKHQLQSYNFKSTELQSVTMPEGDKSSVMCRMNSMISLPEKMTYSKYIADAIQKSLPYINSIENCSPVAHKLSVVLTKVDVNTMKAKWYIDANITVDNHKSINLKTITDHNFSYYAPSACSNASHAFDEAVDNFIRKIFTHPTISKQLR